MGYTHYWSFNKAPRGLAKKTEKDYQLALKECAQIVHAYQVVAEDAARLSGYTAHTKIGEYGGLEVNGKGGKAHEPFTMPEHYSQGGSSFCKTARKPYDVVVTACLAVLRDRLGNRFSVSSDGYSDDWEAGITLASLVLKRKITNPIQRQYKYATDTSASVRTFLGGKNGSL